MKDIEIIQTGAYGPLDQEALEKRFTVLRCYEAEDEAGFLAANGGKVRGLATRGDLAVDSAMMDAMPLLEIISVLGVGYDGVDVQAATARNIRVTNTPGVLTSDVADLTVGMMVCMLRRLKEGDEWVRSGSWEREGPMPLLSRIRGKQAGILGLGRIGEAVARRLEAFEMDISYVTRTARTVPGNWRRAESLPQMAEASDVLILTLSASAESKGIISRGVMEALGPQGLLINVSRASNVDEDAMLELLESGALGAAALDVFEGEPEVNPRLMKLGNVLLHPHHGSGTVETRRDMGRLVIDNLAAHFEGRELPSPVN